MRSLKTTAGAVIVGVTLLTGCGSEQEEVPTVGPTGDQSTVMPQTDAPMVDMPLDEGVVPMGMNEAPEGWPATVPVPVDGLLQAWTEADGVVDATWLLRDMDVDQAGSQYADVITAGGWQGKGLAAGFDGIEGGVGGVLTLDDATITVTVSPGPDADGVYVTVKHERR